ncbi:MAG: hypothetical protein H0U00_12960 [Actinobacteria bacterium]|nr:hypothetical protein [Actinomycetota bacterium]
MLVAVALLASGCGERRMPSVQELEQSIVTTRDRVDFALARITRASSKDELLERMDEAADTIDDAASDLEGVGTSKDYESEVGKLVDSLHQLAFDVQATADQIREPGFGDLLTGTSGLSFESWDKVNLALAGLIGKGIGVAPLERH